MNDDTVVLKAGLVVSEPSLRQIILWAMIDAGAVDMRWSRLIHAARALLVSKRAVMMTLDSGYFTRDLTVEEIKASLVETAMDQEDRK